MFGMGSILAIWLDGRVPAFSWKVRWLLFALALGCFFAAQFRFHIFVTDVEKPYSLAFAYLCSGAGACLIILGFLGVSVADYLRAFVYLGKISYGLYVFHMTGLILADRMMGPSGDAIRSLGKIMVALLGTVMVAALSYKYVESPFIRMKERFAVVASRSV